jgi:SAM-dependent methyltransferase
VVLAEHALPGVDLVSAPDALAVASDSVDAVFLPHTLETTADPHGLLREVDRVLRPDGHIVVVGFNPWGWWGARHVVAREGFPPGAQRMISEGRLHDWLRLLDFKVHHSAFYYFVPPVLRGAVPRHGRTVRTEDLPPKKGATVPEANGRTTRAARAGRGTEGRLKRMLQLLRRGPAFAGCYILVARKQTCVVTPIRLAWRRRTALVGGLVNPTTRTAA